MGVGFGRNHAATGGALEHADLHEVGFVDVFDGSGFFGAQGGQGGEADGAAGVMLDDGGEELAVGIVEAEVVDFEEMEGIAGIAAGDGVDVFDLGVVADAFEEPIGDARGEAAAGGDLGGGGGVEFDAEDAGGAGDDFDHFGV